MPIVDIGVVSGGACNGPVALGRRLWLGLQEGCPNMDGRAKRASRAEPICIFESVVFIRRKGLKR